MITKRQPKPIVTKHRCSVCGVPCNIRVSEQEDTEGRWYCPRHVPPPSELTADRKEQWQAYSALVFFVRDNNRMPSVQIPAELAMIQKVIPGDPSSAAFKKRLALYKRILQKRYMKPSGVTLRVSRC